MSNFALGNKKIIERNERTLLRNDCRSRAVVRSLYQRQRRIGAVARQGQDMDSQHVGKRYCPHLFRHGGGGNGTAVSFPTGGTIRSIDVVVGQRVGAGQVLATVDPTSVRSSYEAAKATLEQAQDAYARMKQLYDKGSLPEIQWVEVQSKLQQAESMERIARKNLGRLRHSRAVRRRDLRQEMEVGQQAAPGMPVVRVVKIDRVEGENRRSRGRDRRSESGTEGRNPCRSVGRQGVRGACGRERRCRRSALPCLRSEAPRHESDFRTDAGDGDENGARTRRIACRNRTSRACRTAGRAEPHVRVARRRRPCRAAVRRVRCSHGARRRSGPV